MKDRIYLDYNGSSPLDSRVAEAMIPVLRYEVGNASSVHSFGLSQADLVARARSQVADFVSGTARGVVFTAGATEANNLALKGTLESAEPGRNRILVSAVEHASVKATASFLAEKMLAKVDVIPVTSGGYVDLDQLDELLAEDVLLVSVMAANSETGVLNDLQEIVRMAHDRGALVHSDVTQMVGRLPFNMSSLGLDMISMSGHKICGPGGVGALVSTRQLAKRLQPVIHGGGHEGGARSGSLNVAGIVGLGVAADCASTDQFSDSARTEILRDRLVQGLRSSVEHVSENGDVDRRLPNTANLRFAGTDADAILANLRRVAASTGSACSSGAIEPSPVLLAMGIDRAAADQAIRFSVGRFTTESEIEDAVEDIVTAVGYVREMETKSDATN